MKMNWKKLKRKKKMKFKEKILKRERLTFRFPRLRPFASRRVCHSIHERSAEIKGKEKKRKEKMKENVKESSRP